MWRERVSRDVSFVIPRAHCKLRQIDLVGKIGRWSAYKVEFLTALSVIPDMYIAFITFMGWLTTSKGVSHVNNNNLFTRLIDSFCEFIGWCCIVIVAKE